MYSVHPHISGNNTAYTRQQLRSIALISALCLFLLGTGVTFFVSSPGRSAGAQTNALITLPGHVPALI